MMLIITISQQSSIVLHVFFQWLGIATGTYLFHQNKKLAGNEFIHRHAWLLIFIALSGAGLGLKLVSFIEEPLSYLHAKSVIALAQGGGTIVGAMLGAYLFIEMYKRYCGIQRSTGDLLVFGLMSGIAIGRIGCFLAGKYDATYGVETTLPWGIDFGDGIKRHPTQIYEVLFLTGFMGVLRLLSARLLQHNGLMFKVFAAGYMAWRLCIDSIKPVPFAYHLLGMNWSGIQLVAFAASLWFVIRIYFTVKVPAHG
ncbi:prolipoprotein diacylglyceryl transferase [Leeia oryzae]|uniref:prolipoprotein diacylglyceryl transferase n=1 Tax=Leeia oryzae TaxID=356662 RepID=UPI0014614D91|nr:prolipoprotein diacylglyceryl transferase family protein [Leeia oryzae]